MDIVFIGSIGMHRHKVNRRPNDIDVICSYDDFVSYTTPSDCVAFYPSSGGKKLIAKPKKGTNEYIVEGEITWDGSNAKTLFDLILSDPKTIKGTKPHGSNFNTYYPSIDVLYMLKMSHRYLRNSPSFLKTMKDIQILRELGAKFDDRYMDWYKEREQETYYYDHPSLNKSKKEFFTDNVNYVYDHDSIHEAVKLNDKPAYTYFMKDGAEVASDSNKFRTQPRHIQLAAVLEESCVLAIERHQVPNNFKPMARDSFLIALEKVCTSITSGWFRSFAWENYDSVIWQYDSMFEHENYVDKFKQALYTGHIKPFEGKY